MTQTPFKLTQLNVEQLKTEAVRPFFAFAGATELAVQLARSYATDTQKSAQERFDAVQAQMASLSRVEYRDPKALQSQARGLVNTRVEELSKEARQAQARFETRVNDLQKDARQVPGRVQAQVTDAVNDLTASYTDLAQRGEKFVDAIRKDGFKVATAVKEAPGKSTVARREAQPAVKNAPARKSTAKKSTAQKSTSKSTASKSTAKKSTARKSTAKKSTTTSA
ncbi:MAG: hypothetical protein ACRDPH_14310 [Marmoricola sp.]